MKKTKIKTHLLKISFLFLNAFDLLFQQSSHATYISEQPLKETIILVPHLPPAGMFSTFINIIGMLQLYEFGCYAGIKVDFGTQGLYYDTQYGENWWSYYCDPIEVGTGFNQFPRISCGFDYPLDRSFIIQNGLDESGNGYPSSYPIYAITLPEFFLSREKVSELICKYIKIKKQITDKVESFLLKNFKRKYVIGIHYRGTDKISEAPRVLYETVFTTINEIIKNYHQKNYKLFVATDEQDFLDWIKEKFPNRVIYQNALRSLTGDPLHIPPQSPYQQGEEALIDSILLSNCNYLIRTSSNLSLWSSFINPTLPVTELNKRYYLTNPEA